MDLETHSIKRVYCLYRVSSKEQVDHDDIPVQRKACHSFAEKQNGWKIIREESELGVSGSKVSASDRDILQDYIKDARKGLFDILLVFMFDRLGRIENETPFVLQGFVANGVECWSVCEGQQRIENHTDKLLNYIRFWQAAGETHKMSQRIGQAHAQTVESGHFRGGHVPFGYKAVHKGRFNKKDQPLMDLEIDPETGPVVAELFHKAVMEGQGSFQLATWVNSQGIRNNTGFEFSHNTVLRILRNPIYTGYFVTKNSRSPHLPELQLVSFETFDRVAEILSDRAGKNEEKRNTALKTQQNGLLSGNVYCGHCGNRMAYVRWQDKKKRKDGTIYIGKLKYKYTCYMRAQKRVDCNGNNSYDAELIENIAVDRTKKLLAGFRSTLKDDALEIQVNQRIYFLQRAGKDLSAEIKQQQAQLKNLISEISKCLMGESSFTEEALAGAINSLRADVEQRQEELNGIQTELKNQTLLHQNLEKYHSDFVLWCDEFGTASRERRRLIFSELYNRIEISKGNLVTVQVSPQYQQFLTSGSQEE